jgi:hypothetical protein
MIQQKLSIVFVFGFSARVGNKEKKKLRNRVRQYKHDFNGDQLSWSVNFLLVGR